MLRERPCNPNHNMHAHTVLAHAVHAHGIYAHRVHAHAAHANCRYSSQTKLSEINSNRLTSSIRDIISLKVFSSTPTVAMNTKNNIPTAYLRLKPVSP
jgi:hypothetical protein